jgi:hypothetical protein
MNSIFLLADEHNRIQLNNRRFLHHKTIQKKIVTIDATIKQIFFRNETTPHLNDLDISSNKLKCADFWRDFVLFDLVFFFTFVSDLAGDDHFLYSIYKLKLTITIVNLKSHHSFIVTFYNSKTQTQSLQNVSIQ